MAGENDSAILGIALRLFRAIYARCRKIARDEVVGYLGQIIRGGRVQWPFLLPGHGYELMQPGVYTFTTTDIPANADTSNVVTVDYPIGYDTAGAAPAVFATSQDSDWIASATPNGSNPHTQVDLSAARRTSLTTPEWDTATSAIAAGDTYVDVTVTFTPHFQSTPVALASVSNPQCRPTLQAVSTTGATFRVSYVPSLPVGTMSNDTTGLTVTAMDPISPATSVKATASTDAGSTGSTKDNSDGTDTGDSSASLTGLTHINHQHAITTPATDTHTQDTDPSHNHGMTHTHPHNTLGGTHTHPVGGVGGHTHPVDDHHHDVDDPGHTHSFTGSPEAAPGGGASFALYWTAIGLRASTATTVDVSWLAVGLQALPS